MKKKIVPDYRIAEIKPGVWAIVVETIIPGGKSGNFWAQVTPATYPSSLAARQAMLDGLRLPIGYVTESGQALLIAIALVALGILAIVYVFAPVFADLFAGLPF